MRQPLEISAASNEQLTRLFYRLDGAWSPLTLDLLKRFGTERLDLNENWAAVPQDWFCPVCRRGKPDLVRLSAEGILLCRLDLHHDHLRDAGKALLQASNPLPEDDLPRRRELLSAIHVCKGLFERFCDILLCPDCNVADGEAKRGIQDVPSSFSFAPSEIAQFIAVQPNVPHRVDLTAARAVWEAVRADHDDRLAFAELLASRIARGGHIRQGSPYGAWRDASSNGEIALALLRDLAGQELWGLSRQLADRSVRRDGFGSAGRRTKARSPRVRAPTAAEWAALDARQARTSGWRVAPDDWCCPVCNRDRKTIPRLANSGEWTAGLHQVAVFDREHDLESYMWRGREPEELVFRSHALVYICQDCRHVMTDVKTQDRTLNGEQLSVHDLRALIGKPEPHVRHDVDLLAAAARARANQMRDVAAREYFAHASASTSASSQYRMARELGLSESEAKLWLADRLNTELETIEDAEWLDWLLREGGRISGQWHAAFNLPSERWY